MSAVTPIWALSAGGMGVFPVLVLTAPLGVAGGSGWRGWMDGVIRVACDLSSDRLLPSPQGVTV